MTDEAVVLAEAVNRAGERVQLWKWRGPQNALRYLYQVTRGDYAYDPHPDPLRVHHDFVAACRTTNPPKPTKA